MEIYYKQMFKKKKYFASIINKIILYLIIDILVTSTDSIHISNQKQNYYLLFSIFYNFQRI